MLLVSRLPATCTYIISYRGGGVLGARTDRHSTSLSDRTGVRNTTWKKKIPLSILLKFEMFNTMTRDPLIHKVNQVYTRAHTHTHMLSFLSPSCSKFAVCPELGRQANRRGRLNPHISELGVGCPDRFTTRCVIESLLLFFSRQVDGVEMLLDLVQPKRDFLNLIHWTWQNSIQLFSAFIELIIWE